MPSTMLPEDPQALWRTMLDSNDPFKFSEACARFSAMLARGVDGIPEGVGRTVARRLSYLELPQSRKAELPDMVCHAFSAALSLLCELTSQRRADLNDIREELLRHSKDEDGLLARIIRILSADFKWTSGGGSAFVHGCFLLSTAAMGEHHLTFAMWEAGLIPVIGLRLLRALSATDRRVLETGEEPNDLMGTSWQPFASAAVRLLRVLVVDEAEGVRSVADPAFFKGLWSDKQQPDLIVDATLAALEERLIKTGGALAVQQLDVDGLVVLGSIAITVPEQQRRLLSNGSLSLAIALLKLAGLDDQATEVGLWYIAELCDERYPGHPRVYRGQLETLHLEDVAVKAVASHFWSNHIRQQALRLMRLIGVTELQFDEMVSDCRAGVTPAMKAKARAKAEAEATVKAKIDAVEVSWK